MHAAPSLTSNFVGERATDTAGSDSHCMCADRTMLLPITAYKQAVSSQTNKHGPTFSRQGDYDLASYAASRWDLADSSPGTLGTKLTHVDGLDLS
jgi:hypothetical protein